MEILLLLVGLILFVALVVVHEFGHFIMARRNGVEVEEFGVGFPPKAKVIGRDKKGTVYTLNWLPLGGFVRLKGEHDADTEKGTFGSVSFWAKTKIILAGVTMNLLTAWIMLTILAFIGIPKLPLPGGEEQFTIKSDTSLVSNRVIIGYIEPGGPAEKAGVKSGDQVLGVIRQKEVINNALSCGAAANTTGDCSADVALQATLPLAKQLRNQTEEILRAGDTEFTLQIKRDGAVSNIKVQPRTLDEVAASEKTDSPKGYLGVVPFDYTVQRSTWSAPIVGAGLVAQYSRLTYSALGNSIKSLFQGKGSEASENVSGPIGIFVVLKEGASLGPSYILLIIALLSLTLAIMNTLPIPALDGGKLAVMIIFRAIKKPLTPKLEEQIHGTGFVALMLLFVVITFVDVRRFF